MVFARASLRLSAEAATLVWRLPSRVPRCTVRCLPRDVCRDTECSRFDVRRRCEEKSDAPKDVRGIT